MSESTATPTAPKKGKTTPTPKPTAARADHGAETYNLKNLCALLRVLKPHAGFGTMRTGTEALKNVMLVCDGKGNLRATAKGAASGITMTIPVSGDIRPMQELVDPKRLLGTLDTLKGDTVVLRFEKSKLHVFADDVNASLTRELFDDTNIALFDREIPTQPESGFKVNAGAFAAALKRVTRFVIKDAQRYGINGLCLQLIERSKSDRSNHALVGEASHALRSVAKDDLFVRAVGTDGHRLCFEHVNVIAAVDSEDCIANFVSFFKKNVLGFDFFPNLLTFLDSLPPESDLWVSTSSDTKVSFYSPACDAHLFFSGNDGEFPEYTRVLPHGKSAANLDAQIHDFKDEIARFCGLCSVQGAYVTEPMILHAPNGQKVDFRQVDSKQDNPLDRFKSTFVHVSAAVKTGLSPQSCYGLNRDYFLATVTALATAGPPDSNLHMLFYGPLDPIELVLGDDINRPFIEPGTPYMLMMPMKLSNKK